MVDQLIDCSVVQVFSISLETDAPFEPSMIWWLGVAIMACAVALACTVPDPRVLRAAQHNPLAGGKAGNEDLSERLIGGDEGGESPRETPVPKPSVLDNFYMWVANL